ncbi:lipopolysaccharide assembly protein LapA domain-containing protein [Paenirhodobacter populi]|uniref:lipopolysaccharide assembly protein LapA domain-containing protein n=1 Tax=Paenirhodobacter populi TaxID=2306993 RepID=UPI00267A7611
MLRLLRLLALALVAIALIVVSIANRETVTLHALPLEAGSFLGYSWSVQLPLFLVILGGILVGLLLGFVWEWARERRIRVTAVKAKREVAWLEGEVDRLKSKTEEKPKDEVLALLDKPAGRG